MNNLLMTIKIAFLFFTLSILAACGGGGGNGNEGTPIAEGSDVSPQSISLNTPYRGSVDTTESFYTVPVTAGTKFTISITDMTDNVDLVVFKDNDWSSSYACSQMNDGTVTDECSAIPTGSALYILIMGDLTSSGAFYTITVTPIPPAAPTGVSATAGNNQVEVKWSNVSDATSYNLYFSETSGASTSGTKITNVPSPYIHTGRTNGVTYYYVVTAVNANGESVASGQVYATPTAPLSPPQTFNFDDNSLQGWTATGTWGLTSAVTYSNSSFAVTDSPSGYYSNNTNSSITSPRFDLSGIGPHTLSFYHRYETEGSYDYAYVQVSSDGGLTFATVGTYSGIVSSFYQVTIDLTSYSSNSVVIRFRLSTDFSNTYEGWYIDNIVVQ